MATPFQSLLDSRPEELTADDSAADNVLRAHSIHVITAGDTAIVGLVVFLDPALFSMFGLSPTR